VERLASLHVLSINANGKDGDMSLSLSVALTLGFLIAYANGSNDVSKGIATLAVMGDNRNSPSCCLIQECYRGKIVQIG
jgi:phosphate/sulfate permease